MVGDLVDANRLGLAGDGAEHPRAPGVVGDAFDLGLIHPLRDEVDQGPVLAEDADGAVLGPSEVDGGNNRGPKE